MALDYSQWDRTFKVSAEEVKELDQNNGKKEYVEVPFGQYEVKVTKMELGCSKAGDPMLRVQFKVLEGRYKDNFIFMNQLVNQSFLIHKANDFLRSLDSRENIEWTGRYSDYADLIDKVFNAIDKKLEYVLDYHSDSKGYNVFEVKEVFEVK